mmetsp:Transcript_8056/g.10205  ORF Transcript_8056/g.10205 Transcript_8056/m.10205 type:complete len:104 (+) Transcript_8056:356-667(+)
MAQVKSITHPCLKICRILRLVPEMILVRLVLMSFSNVPKPQHLKLNFLLARPLKRYRMTQQSNLKLNETNEQITKLPFGEVKYLLFESSFNKISLFLFPNFSL